jgi:hypothetical protein
LEEVSLFERNLESSTLYFDRVKGIFRICFPYSDRPKPVAGGGHLKEQVVLYLNPIEEWCTNINYFLDFEKGIVPVFLVRRFYMLICLIY